MPYAGALGSVGPRWAELLWDGQNDWSLTDTSGNPEVTRTRVITPTRPYRGGLGRMVSAFTGSSSDFSTYARHALSTPGRFLRLGCALRFPDVNFATVRSGPLMVEGRDGAAASLGVVWSLAWSQALDIHRGFCPNGWILVDATLASEGASAPFRVSGHTAIYVALGSGVWLHSVANLLADTACKDFSAVRLGWTGLSQIAGDRFTVEYDELRVQTADALPAHVQPLSWRHAWQATP